MFKKKPPVIYTKETAVFFNRTVVKVFLYPNIIKISETAHSSPIFFSANKHHRKTEQA